MIGAVASIGVDGLGQSYTSTSAFFPRLRGHLLVHGDRIPREACSSAGRKDSATLRGLVIWDLPAAKAPVDQTLTPNSLCSPLAESAPIRGGRYQAILEGP